MKPGQSPSSDYVNRRSHRQPIDDVARLRHQWYSVEVRIRDVSQCGFMAECGEAVAIGSNVSLDVPGIGPVHAQVRWQLGGKMGGLFLDPISLTQCEWTAVKTERPKEPA
jgi:hypothetical protein